MLSVRRSVSAFVLVAVGVALVAAATLLLASGRPRVPDRLAYAAVVVQSPEAGAPADSFAPTRPWSAARAAELTSRLTEVPGVTAVVPDRTFYAQALVDGRPPPTDGQREDAHQGHGWSSTRLGGFRLTAGSGCLPAGRSPCSRRQGPSRTPSPVWSMRPASTSRTRSPPHSRPVSGPSVCSSRRTPMPRTSPRRRALTADGRGALEPRGDARTRWIGMQVLTATAALAGFVTVFVVASAFAFTVAQRRRELGLLRAVGATGRQVRRMVYVEALVVGVTAGLAGLLVGAGLAPVLDRLLVDAGFQPATFRVRYEPWPVAVSLAAGPDGYGSPPGHCSSRWGPPSASVPRPPTTPAAPPRSPSTR
ncbi:ABC transporter permease [Verrucosispora sioxanthis]|uniref:ABC transporter permease n=1 Tax=Verrucosispora sioxanthis TaxID=2499994 RepID=UPI002814ABCF|nr:ABC transporter permease [Verrucosispora sioxanthis]